MNRMQSTALGLVLAMAACTCFAQETSIPSAPLPDAPRLQAGLKPVVAELPCCFSLSVSPVASAANLTPVRLDKTIDAKFVMLNSLHMGIMTFDVEMTQRCIAHHHCQEGNPLMPSSHAGQLAIGAGLVTYSSGLSYWLKKRKSRLWWIPPVAGVVAHTVGAATGFIHQ